MTIYLAVPVVAAVLGAIIATFRRPSPLVVSAIQHFAAGVVFAAAAGEVLPDIVHQGSRLATVVGGAAGVAVMLLIKSLEAKSESPAALMAAVGVDILVDGLVLGLGFAAGQKTGLLLTIALTIELLFLGLTVTAELGENATSALRVIGLTTALILLLPIGALIAMPVALLPPVYLTALLSFGLMALLYLVTEELLVEAHETPDRPWITATFFAGFLLLVLLEESIS